MPESETDGQLVGTFEIRERYGIPRHRLHRFKARGLWPLPLASLHCGEIWRLADVEATVSQLKANGQLEQ
jgi:hypothetical protein